MLPALWKNWAVDLCCVIFLEKELENLRAQMVSHLGCGPAPTHAIKNNARQAMSGFSRTLGCNSVDLFGHAIVMHVFGVKLSLAFYL